MYNRPRLAVLALSLVFLSDIGLASQRENSMEVFKGKFERTSAENYEEFLKAMDVGYLLRKAATVSTPSLEVTETGGVWTFKTSTTLKSMELKFKLGVEFSETTPDGREVTSLVTFNKGQLVTVQTAKKPGQKSTRSVREMKGEDELVYTMTIEGNNDLVCTQTFKRI